MPTYETRDGKIRAKVRVAPFSAQSRTFDRKEDAKLWAEPLEADLKKKKRAGILDEEIYTYADLIDDYLKYQLPKRSSDREMFHQKALWWRKELGTRQLSQVKTRDIAELRDKLASEPLYTVDKKGNAVGRTDETTGEVKLKKPATIHKYLSVLSAMCRYNINERGWLRTNPVLSTTKPSVRNDRVRFLTDEERPVLLDACLRSENRLLFPIVLFALATGARKGEILKLKLADLDPEYKRATLRDTKNGDTRTVHIPPMLRQCLLSHLEWLDITYGDDLSRSHWLFPREDCQRSILIRAAWETARDESAEKMPSLGDFRFHDLRHTFASYLAMSGATLLQLKEAMGHRTLKAVERYAHLTEDHTQEVVQRMASTRLATLPGSEGQDLPLLEDVG